MKRTVFLLLLNSLLGAMSSSADNLRESYIAVLSERDHFNSRGERLTNAAAIIRQDRANYHRLGKRDAGDEGDRFFADANNREALENLIKRGTSSKDALRAIIQGTPTIVVSVFEAGEGHDYVNVSVLDVGVEQAGDAELVESYMAVLSERDHLNSRGERLTDAAAIIRQDRANYHKLRKRDPGDEGDGYFADANNREALENLIKGGSSTKAALRAITKGTPAVLVQIFRTPAGTYFVNVSVMD